MANNYKLMLMTVQKSQNNRLPFNRVTEPRISSKLLSNVDCILVCVVDSLSTKPRIRNPFYYFQNKISFKKKKTKYILRNTWMLIHRTNV